MLCAGGIEHGSSGFLLPNIQAKVVDAASGESLPRGSEGELCVKGPNNMLGYLNRPEASAQSLTADGWLRTGDMARIDDSGNVIVGDRLKEFIKVKVKATTLRGPFTARLARMDVAWTGAECGVRAAFERRGQ